MSAMTAGRSRAAWSIIGWGGLGQSGVVSMDNVRPHSLDRGRSGQRRR
jgi:hypothetical protein